MTNPKRTIMLVLLFMVIGIAAVTTNVVINGSTSIAKNSDDFNVYFSNVLVNRTQDLSLVKNEKKLVFNKDFSLLNDKIEITYDVTNGSKDYDAQVSIDCTPSTDYLTITNEFDTATNLAARSTKPGVLTVTLSKTNTGADITEEISCTISANAVERTSQVTSTVVNPLNPFYIGREVAIGEEKFNIISSDETTVTMFAKYNIGANNKQSIDSNDVSFSYSNGWENSPGPIDVEIGDYPGETLTLLNKYVEYLKNEYGVDATGDLITLKQLGELGCIISSDYSYVDGLTCSTSTNSEWLAIDNYSWTRSADLETPMLIWYLSDIGLHRAPYDFAGGGVRPTITVSKEVAEQLLNVYPVGKEISIGTEKFNVISDNGTTISMLAQYNIMDYFPYIQASQQMNSTFSNKSGWEYTPGPKEINIQQYDGETKTLLNGYVSYLNGEYSVDVTGDLITLKELEKIGCTVPENYAGGTGGMNCIDSEHYDWLANQTTWWTRSADSLNSTNVWMMEETGRLYSLNYLTSSSVRPVIKIDKSYLE